MTRPRSVRRQANPAPAYERQAQAYFKDKAKGELAQAAADLVEKSQPGTQETGQPAESDPAGPPSTERQPLEGDSHRIDGRPDTGARD
jgi:hypothetical protein